MGTRSLETLDIVIKESPVVRMGPTCASRPLGGGVKAQQRTKWKGQLRNQVDVSRQK